MKIVFIGAGMAALVAAYELGKAGFDVTVFEKKRKEEISYDWHDDVNVDAFRRYGLPMPKKYFRKRNWTFVPPSERVEVTLSLEGDELDLSIERRELALQYIDRASSYAQIIFDSKVDGLIMRDGKVLGVKVGGEEIYADLVVDDSGALSPFRAAVLKDSEPKNGELFVTYRGFHKMKDGESLPAATNRAYLKHMGEVGISWSIIDPSGTVNVLIGRVDELSDETLKKAYERLKLSNPIISDEVVRGGIRCVIPIRYPLTRMFSDGYVAIGDAAYMTIPMIGSGIENGMKAAIMLADAVKAGGVGKDALYAYQRRYFMERGAEHIGVDVLKRWLLGCKASDLDVLFEKGVISPKDMAAGATGKLITLSFGDILVKLKKGIGDLPLLLKLNGVVNKTKRAKRIGLAMPQSYDEEKFAKWEKKVKALFK